MFGQKWDFEGQHWYKYFCVVLFVYCKEFYPWKLFWEQQLSEGMTSDFKISRVPTLPPKLGRKTAWSLKYPIMLPTCSVNFSQTFVLMHNCDERGTFKIYCIFVFSANWKCYRHLNNSIKIAIFKTLGRHDTHPFVFITFNQVFFSLVNRL